MPELEDEGEWEVEELQGKRVKDKEPVSRAVDLDGGCEEIERSAILNNCGNDIIKV
jgi:hypothetical protein